MQDIAIVLAVNAGVILALFVLAWAACVAMRDCTPVDSLWGAGMGVVAISTFLQTGGGTERRLVLTVICVAWALRLAGYLLWRWRDHGPDRRYVRMMDKATAERGWGYGYAAFRLVFLLQMPLLWLVCLPVQLGQIAATPAMPMLLFSRELNVENADLRAAFRGRLATFQCHLTREVAAGQQNHALRSDVAAADAAMLLASLVQGVAIRWSLGARDFALNPEGLRLLDVQLRLLAAKGG